MIKTLALFLSRELWKVTGLSLVAFTLVMTVFAIIEPLRREGLSGQLGSLLAFTVPAMLSLTLPIAALFAATIVYGRFAQDNELTACRASGISTLRLLKSALFLGGVVTILSLFLNNVVTPRMLIMMEKSAKANVMDIVKRKFKSQNYIEYTRYTVHADEVEQMGDTLMLKGIVASDTRRKDDPRFLTASTAVVTFEVDQGETFATISLTRPAVSRGSSRDIVEMSSMPLPPQAIPSVSRENASWYTWNQLIETLRQPVRNMEIGRKLTNIKRRMGNDMLATAIIERIKSGQPYEELIHDNEVYSIRAADARKGNKEIVDLFSSDDAQTPVEVLILRNGKVRQQMTADRGSIEMIWSTRENSPMAVITLHENVKLTSMNIPGAETQRRTEWELEQCSVPEEIRGRAEKIGLEDVYRRADSLTKNDSILKEVKTLKENDIPRVTNRIKAELHGRIAYGVSCFLMVAMGAAMGLIFRGGQIISAFTLSVMPASVVIVMMLMGKEMMKNPDASTVFGLFSIWSGIVILLIADALIYVHLARK